MFIYAKKFRKIVNLETGTVTGLYADAEGWSVAVYNDPIVINVIFQGAEDECVEFLESLVQSMLTKGVKFTVRA